MHTTLFRVSIARHGHGHHCRDDRDQLELYKITGR
jgi:hypothetical protein